jgi:replicative DNA helicase
MATPEETIQANWDTLSGKIIAVILSDPAAVFPVIQTIGNHSDWFSGAYRHIYATAVQCINNDLNATTTNIAAQSGGKITIEHLDNISAALWTEEASRDLVANTEALKALGVVFNMRDIGQALAGLTDPQRIEEIMNFVELSLAEIASNRSKRKGDAETIADKAWDLKGLEVFETGLSWFDRHTGGFWGGRITWFPARFKGGKSTLMRNVVLNMLRNGVACEVFLAEGSQEQFARDMIVMIAVELLYETGTPPAQIKLSSDRVSLSILRPDEVKLTEAEQDALALAKHEFSQFPLRAWDIQDGIDDLVTAAYVVKQGKMDQGTRAVFFDYSQLFRIRGTSGIYESATANAIFLQKLAAKEGVSVCVLAQKNTKGVVNTGKDSEYSDHVSGGGAAEATADYVLVPDISPQDHGIFSVMKVQMTRSRHGRPTFGVHSLDPETGMIIDRFVTMTTEDLMSLADRPQGEDDAWLVLNEAW